MPEVAGARESWAIGWWLRLMIGLLPVVLAALLLFFWIRDHVPRWVYWRIGLGFLIALEVAYIAVPVLALVAAPLLVVHGLRARRRGQGRRALWLARGLLLSLSVLLGAVLSETAAATWRAWADRGLLRMTVDRGSKPQGTPPLQIDPQPITLPSQFPEPSGDDEVHLVVLGESSAAGVPYNFWLSIGHIVTWKLQEAIPDRQFRLNIVAQSGAVLEQQHELLSRLSRRPDVLIVYCGHNEFSARIPSTRMVDHYRDQPPPAIWEVFVAWVERTSALCGWIRELSDKCRIAVPPPPEASRSLVDVPAYTPAESRALRADFESRLDQIVTFAEGVGAIPILIIPAANDADFEPNRSFLPAARTYPERAAFARDFLAARRLEAHDPSRALALYRALVVREPEFAETHYRMARLLARAGDGEAAYRHAIRARDLDGLPMRCLTSFQEAYRAVASRHDCILIDAQAGFHAIGARGQLDDHLFHDLMHPSLRGQMVLAQAILDGLHAWRAFGWPEGTPAPRLDPARCAAHFGLGAPEWERICLWGIMVYDAMSPVRYDPSRRRAKKMAFAKAFQRIEKGEAPESVGLPNVGVPTTVPAFPEAAIQIGQPGRNDHGRGTRDNPRRHRHF
jgi:lysophospholipase L1-like esterase